VGRVARLSEAHVIRLDEIKRQATVMVEEAWQELSSRVNVRRLGEVFGALEQVGSEVIGIHGKRAVSESARYAETLLGFQPGTPTLADMGNTVEDHLDELAEHTRHVRVLLEIRTRRMARKGIDQETITSVVRADFQNSAEMFGLLKNSVKRTVGSAVLQLGKDAEHAAFRRASERKVA